MKDNIPMKRQKKIRVFSTGAKRDTDEGKLDYEGFLSPEVLKIYAEYMDKHMLMRDGSRRSSDDWQKGISKEVYMKSGLRHVHDVWMEHRGYESREGLRDALCGVIFNFMGYLFQDIHEEKNKKTKTKNS